MQPKSNVAVAVPPAPIAYPEPNTKMVTEHTLSLVRPVLQPGWSVLDIGCGSGYVLGELSSERPVTGIDIVDTRATPLENFKLYDGLTLDFPDNSFDVALLVFVMHHVPNDKKKALMDEVKRVVRHRIVVVEDTPRNPIDWLAGWLHGRKHRREIGSDADFGFYNQRGWEKFFGECGLRITKSEALPRLCRIWYRPWARSCFWLEKS
jgi:ubiquinone/menaquinone biosynthesis C-methylase UbiE